MYQGVCLFLRNNILATLHKSEVFSVLCNRIVVELHAGLVVFLSQPVKSEERESDRNKCSRKNANPHKNTGNTLRIQIYKEVGIDQGGGRSGNQNRRVKFQNDRLDQ